ncbi:MAG: leucine-rich repeat domain-containing protein [Pseudohongiellaceae bacterium]|nr:leucine-rich repeat domain-containing protein [Pseudohongiellaceae bacterium]
MMSIVKTISLVLLTASVAACGQKYTVSVNNQSVYDPRPNQTQVRFSDTGLQACVNLAIQQTGLAVEELKVLSCPQWEIEQIESIGALRSLQFLDLSNNAITSIAPVVRLRNLSSITLSNNKLRDISPLERVATLNFATLSGNPNIPCEQIDKLRQRLANNLISGECS